MFGCSVTNLKRKCNNQWLYAHMLGLPDGSVVRNSSASAGDAGDTGLIPGSGGNGNPLQYSCLENLMGRAA